MRYRPSALRSAAARVPAYAAALIAITAAPEMRAQVKPINPRTPIIVPRKPPELQILRAEPPAPKIWGFADLHVHQFNNLGFGGIEFWGQPYGPPEQALAWCTPAHGPGGIGDLFGEVLQHTDEAVPLTQLGHFVGGFPEFDGWPRWNTFTHQQVYADWLKRAHDGGLQLMVMLAGNNSAICEPLAKAPGRTCDDMEAVEREINGAKAMEGYVDGQSGGRGQGWYRIVYSPQDARSAIAKGQLAVVLGAEVPTIFGCREGGDCDPLKIRARLERYRAMGLRQLNPIHNVDNAFGGSAAYTDIFNFANNKISGHWFSVRDCSAQGVGFRFNGPGGLGPQVQAAAKTAFARLFGGAPSPLPYSEPGQCNSRGLTSLGEFFIGELMAQRMIIDVDHMSWLSSDRTLQLTHAQHYPVVSSHTGFFTISRTPAKRHEAQKRDDQLSLIREDSGLVAPILFQGSSDETNAQTHVPHDCSNSSQSWAQAYLYAIKMMNGPVAVGSDINGFAGMPSPRFGKERCNYGQGRIGNEAQLGGRISYPIPVHGVADRALPQSVVGRKTFDYNDDGFAHIGMYPDFIQDLWVQGVTDQELEPLFRSAEAYIHLWERVEASTAPAADLRPPPALIVEVQQGPATAADTKVTVTLTAKDAFTKKLVSAAVVIDAKGGAVTGTTDSPLTFTLCGGGIDPDLAGDGGRAPVAKPVVMKRGPCPAHVSANGYPTVTLSVGQLP